MNPDPPPPSGLLLHELTPAQIDTVLDEVFDRGVRCGLLDRPPIGPPAPTGPAAPQWLLAELGDGRITGSCLSRTWHRSDTDAPDLSAPAPGNADRWRILEVLVFTPHAQIRLGEGAERGWISADAPGPLPAPLRPRDRALLLRGRHGGEHRRPLRAASHDTPALTVTSEPDGTRAVLPLDPVDATAATRPLDGGRTLAHSAGTWLTVREYWAEDPETGAVGVAFHRLTGFRTGPDPTGPAPDPGTGDPARGA
ncbi:hypothetical protein IDM40_13470 [Nocardiopsis sp. HNM0947]|uniref:Uncharacterized protein n=1 Tax=Nocardiopsis coralli TaxID=2772213 RepID=A0ABR9P789_9ACTN|nr:hypothetical protein [Nocardiopsis coralli]MBE2999711.1 hypothetical protein [Nocardiopsis coralli]